MLILSYFDHLPIQVSKNKYGISTHLGFVWFSMTHERNIAAEKDKWHRRPGTFQCKDICKNVRCRKIVKNWGLTFSNAVGFYVVRHNVKITHEGKHST